MNRLAKFQLLGPVALFLTVLAAEISVCALSLMPSSEALWFINVKLFLIFQRTYYIFSDVTGIPATQLLVALPISLLACYGFIRKQTLPLAVASNLSFCYAVFLLVSWNQIEKSASMQASLSVIAIPTGASLYTLAILLGSSLLSFLFRTSFTLSRFAPVALRSDTLPRRH